MKNPKATITEKLEKRDVLNIMKERKLQTHKKKQHTYIILNHDAWANRSQPYRKTLKKNVNEKIMYT